MCERGRFCFSSYEGIHDYKPATPAAYDTLRETTNKPPIYENTSAVNAERSSDIIVYEDILLTER